MTAFESAARAFVSSRRSPGTRALYGADLNRWLKWYGEYGHGNDPAHPTLQAATAYRDELASVVSPTTVRRMILALSAVYGNAVDDGGRPIASWNPFKRLPRPPAVKFGKTEAISEKDAEAIVQAAEEADGDLARRDVAIIRLLRDTGLRVSSIVAIRHKDFFRRDGALLVRVVVKGGKAAEVQIQEAVEESIKVWCLFVPVKSPYLFPARGQLNEPMNAKAVNKRLNIYARAAGIGHVSPHQFRAAFITAALDAGEALSDVQASVHHDDPRTTQRYDRGVRGLGVASAVSKWRAKTKTEKGEHVK